MYLTPMLFSPLPGFLYCQPLQPFRFNEFSFVPELYQKRSTLNSTVQKFLSMIPLLAQNIRVPILTDYMNLNQKYSEIQLPTIEQFIPFYNSILIKYKTTYASHKIKHSWSQHDIIILLWIVNWLYQTSSVEPINFSKTHWVEVASLIPFRSGEDCMYKWLSMRNNQLEESPWTLEQKNTLAFIMESSSESDWANISRLLHKMLPKNYRTPKQCKQTWGIILGEKYERSKKLWSFEEDMILVDSFSKCGRRWKEIAKEIKGRSQNAIKNRFTLLSQKYCNKEIVTRHQRDLIMKVKSRIKEEQELLVNNRLEMS